MVARLLLASTSSSTVRTQHAEGPGQNQPGYLTAQPAAAQAGDKQAHRIGRAVLVGIDAEPGAADAVAVVLESPRADARIKRPVVTGQMLASVIAAAIPLPPPRRAVAVLFPGVDGMAQPVINIRFQVPSQDDMLSLQRGQ